MPKEISHWILAERTLNGLSGSSRISGIIRDNQSVYLGGAVLPDTLLHLIRGPHSRTALRLADRFHDARGNSFAPLINAAGRHPEGIPHDLLACLLGVVSHITADSVFHPYVYALTGVDAIGMHYRLETALDVHFMHRGSVPPARRLDGLITVQTRQTLVTAAAILFDPAGELPLAAIEHALELHCRYQSMYDRPLWKIAAVILGNLPGSPFRDQRHLFYPLDPSGAAHRRMIDQVREWRHPVSGATQKASVDDLAGETVEKTVAIFRRIDDLGSLAAALEESPGVNLLTGLRDVGMREMKRGLSDRRSV